MANKIGIIICCFHYIIADVYIFTLLCYIPRH